MPDEIAAKLRGTTLLGRALKDYLQNFQCTIEFPDPKDSVFFDGVAAVGGQLNLGTLIHAYARGIFPWPHGEYPNLWFCPDRRGVLEFADLHISNSLKKFSRRNPQLQVRFSGGIVEDSGGSQSFSNVMIQCAQQKRKDQDGTWINREVLEGYHALFEKGLAWSAECWDLDRNIMVGGMYGVCILGVVSGESMFYHKPNTSKLAFWCLIEHLRKLGYRWMDTQMVTPLVEKFGGKYVDRHEYLEKYLATSQERWLSGHFG